MKKGLKFTTISLLIVFLFSNSIFLSAGAVACNGIYPKTNELNKVISYAKSKGVPSSYYQCNYGEYPGCYTFNGPMFGYKLCRNHGDISNHLNDLRIVATWYNTSSAKRTISGTLSVSDSWMRGGSLGSEITASYNGLGGTIKSERNWSYAQNFTTTLNYNEKVSPYKTGKIAAVCKGRFEAGMATKYKLWLIDSYSSYYVGQTRSISYFYGEV